MTSDLEEYVQIDIECAHLTKSKQLLGKMDPFVVVLMGKGAAPKQVTRSPTHWDSHKEPVWYHACPKIPLDDQAELTFKVVNDSSLGRVNWSVLGITKISIAEVIHRARNSKAKSLGLAAKLSLQLDNNEGTLVVSVKVKDDQSRSELSLLSMGEEASVDTSWFESPVHRLGVSGGTAPFFALQLTPTGLQETKQSSVQYYIGKDLSHAEDEKDFYEDIRRIAEYNQETQGVGLLVPFMFDYLGVLTTRAGDMDEDCQLLVMQNLRNNYKTFRMLDLKMGQQTAQGGWQGKSRFRAMKQNVLDGMTNSKGEGYRLEGFDGNPQRIESMDPLIDLLAKESGNDIDNVNKSSKTLLWGRQVTEKEVKKAKRIMFQTLTGADIFRYLVDVHLEPNSFNVNEEFTDYLPVEVVEIVLQELVSRLVHLAGTCHCLSIPQKWIGSSVALGYDAGLFPKRSNPEADTAIRSKVIVNVFDWGRSELLTLQKYQAMADVDKQDRQRFWDNYKNGMDRLAFNATREYYHHFTNTRAWTQITLQVMDFDSMTSDDYMGKVDISLPDPSQSDVLHLLQKGQEYQLKGTNGAPQGSIFCSISWLAFPDNSRLVGCWRVCIQRAANLPVKDVGNTSDPYVIVIARDACNRRNLQQMTCVKARNLNPAWNETIDVPVVKENNLKTAMTSKGSLFDDSFPSEDRELSKLFQLNEGRPDDITHWTECLKQAASCS